MTINQDKQSLSPGTRIELFDFDARSLGGELYHFCSSFKQSGNILWQGKTYVALPISADGFEINAKGAFPTPRMRLSNVKNLPGSIINDIGDPIGAIVTRWVTFDKYLDDGITPNPDEHFAPQIFKVERKVTQSKVVIEFELSSTIDQEGRQIPKRQVLRDTCSFIYRVWNPATNSYDYTKATCPYAGANKYLPNGTPTVNPQDDLCGKRLSDCRLRFGNAPLPFGGFPAVSRVR